jgi:hypothetical protein
MKLLKINRIEVIDSSLWVLFFWFVIGLIIHIWIPNGQDAEHNIIHLQNKPLMTRLVHFSYIFSAYSIYHLLDFTGITALQSLAIVSILSFSIGGWAIFKIGYKLNGTLFGWLLSLLVWPLPLLVQQAQGQEYQPFAMAMLVLSWYFWINHKSLILTSIAWAVSVLANPSHAFLFASFTSFLLLEKEPVKKVLNRSLRLWLLSAGIVAAVWGPFYEELLFGSWAVVPVLSKTGLFDLNKLFRSGVYLGYAFISNFYIVIFAIPFTKMRKHIGIIFQNKQGSDNRCKVFLWFLSFFLNIVFIFLTVGGGKYGRAWSPVLHWLALFFFIGIFKLVGYSELEKITRRWRWVVIVQLMIVLFVYALPFKKSAYDRYDDYHMIAQKYPNIQVATTGALNIRTYNLIENKLQIVNLDGMDEVDGLKSKLESGQIDSFILSYGIYYFDRAVIRRFLPKKIIEKTHINYYKAEDMLKKKGFKVKIEPLKDTKGGEMYFCKGD